jgi:hypothetical protein
MNEGGVSGRRPHSFTRAELAVVIAVKGVPATSAPAVTQQK